MTNMDLLYSMGSIDPNLIADAAPDACCKKKPWAKYVSNAAASGILVLAFLFFAGSVLAVAYNNNVFYQIGEYLKNALSEDKLPGGKEILAQYDGIPITAIWVEYNKNMNIMFDEETAAQRDTDYEVINKIVESMILQEEAQRLGLSATESEIEAMVDSAIRAYSLPQGKEMIDPYLEGADITFDEYLDMLREQAPRVIARQKLLDQIGRQYCEEHGMVFTKLNPPAEMIAAQDAYVADLFAQNKHKIVYFIEIPVSP